MNEIQLFSKENLGQVRIVVENNEPLFCLRDICEVIEHSNPSKLQTAIVGEFGDGLTQSYPIKDSVGRVQNAIFITEPQLYFILMRSDKPQAKPFRQWVVNEVLPSIRKTSSYSLTPKTYKEALLELVAQIEKTEALEAENKEQQKVIEYQGDKLDSYKAIEVTRRSKAELRQRLNRNIRLLGKQKYEGDISQAYKDVYAEFGKCHCINETINMEYLAKNNDYLAECLSITLQLLK